jgi:hypothetical protein
LDHDSDCAQTGVRRKRAFDIPVDNDRLVHGDGSPVLSVVAFIQVNPSLFFLFAFFAQIHLATISGEI